MMENVTIFGVIFDQNGAKSSPPTPKTTGAFQHAEWVRSFFTNVNATQLQSAEAAFRQPPGAPPQ